MMIAVIIITIVITYIARSIKQSYFMSSPNFRFKQFTIWHDRCAMKVGTDGVLLGAWCPLNVENSEYKVLDVGTGSGLIALMLAQRITTLGQSLFTIDSIDINAEAVGQAMYNFEQSHWKKNLAAYQSSLQDWHSEKKYDLIVSNPPYFQDSLKNPDAQRATARHTDTLTYKELIIHTAHLLHDDGILALILPIEAKETIMEIAEEQQLIPTHITHVHSKAGKPVKRLLIAFEKKHSKHPTRACHISTFHIEGIDTPRSEEYKKLTEDFYL